MDRDEGYGTSHPVPTPLPALVDLYIYVLVYIDDLLITGNDVSGISKIKANFLSAFTIKDLGLARYFLGIEIARSSDGTFLNHRKYSILLIFSKMLV